MRTKKSIATLTALLLFLIHGCDKNGTKPNDGPNEVPLDGRGGGVIAFSITPPGGNNEIYLMNADGTGLTRITHTNGHAIQPDWRPEL